jgi:hypothetical protein
MKRLKLSPSLKHRAMGMPFRGGMLFKSYVQPKQEMTDMEYRRPVGQSEFAKQKIEAILKGGKVLKPLHFSK